MAGKLKPNIPKLGEEITLKDISYVNVTWSGKTFFGKGLFDELNNGVSSEQNCAWGVEGDYLQFTTEKKINIWRQGSYFEDASNPLKIYKKNANGNFIDVTDTIEQIVTVLPDQIWEKTISNLEAGTYKFTGSGKTRIDGEWYVEKVNTTKYLIQNKNNFLYTLEGGNGYTENLIPTMTSNTSPSGIASSSSNYDNTRMSWKAFNKIADIEGWVCAEEVGWLQYKFISNKIISKYTITAGESGKSAPKSWTFEGSNDGINFIVLDTQNNIVSWNSYEKKNFTFVNNDNYLYYRLNIKVSGGLTTVNELEMMSRIPFNINILGNELTEDLFKNKGFSDVTVIKNQQIIKKGIYGMDKGTLGNGKMFEFSLKNDIKTINSIE